MVREMVWLDISAMPEVAKLVEEARRENRALGLRRGDERVAMIIPSRGARGLRASAPGLVDTSALPPVPYRTVDEMMASRPAWVGRSFADIEIAEALDEERADAWEAWEPRS